MAIRRIGDQEQVVLDQNPAPAQSQSKIRKIDPSENITLDAERAALPARAASPVYYPQQEADTSIWGHAKAGAVDFGRRLYAGSANVMDLAADKLNQAEYGVQKAYYDVFGYPVQDSNQPDIIQAPTENFISQGLRDRAEQDMEAERVLAGRLNQMNVQDTVTWDQAKANPFSSQMGRFILEQGARSAPEMAAAFIPFAGVPLVGLSTTQNVLEERLQNQGFDATQIPSGDDMVMAAGTGLLSAGLERLGVVGDVARPLGGAAQPVARAAQIPGAMARSGAGEAATEFFQEGTEYVGSTLGTDQDVTAEGFIDRGLQGAVVGGPMGAGIRGGTETARLSYGGARERLSGAQALDQGQTQQEMGADAATVADPNVPHETVAPAGPVQVEVPLNRQDLADALNNDTPLPESKTVELPQVDIDPELQAMGYVVGSNIEQINEDGEIFTGKLVSAQVIDGEIEATILDDAGHLKTLFSSGGQISPVANQQQAAPVTPEPISVDVVSEQQYRADMGQPGLVMTDAQGTMYYEDGAIIAQDGTVTYGEPTDAYKARMAQREQLTSTAEPMQPPVEQPRPKKTSQQEEIATLGLDQLAQRLQGVKAQAKRSGWNKRLTTTRDLLTEQLNTRFPEWDVPTNVNIEDAAQDVAPEPTDGQKEAGNYKKGHVSVQGLPITLENPKGTARKGKDRGGNEWQVEMPAHYGYIKRTEGADGDHLDVYIGDRPSSDQVVIVDQIDPETGDFDEHKALIGFQSLNEAMQAYQGGFSDGSGAARAGGVTSMNMQDFKDWLKSGKTKKPLTYKKPKPPEPTPEVQDLQTTGVQNNEEINSGDVQRRPAEQDGQAQQNAAPNDDAAIPERSEPPQPENAQQETVIDDRLTQTFQMLDEAIESKSADTLREIVGNLDNKQSRARFEQKTGQKLPKTKAKTLEFIDTFAGVTPEQRSATEAKKQSDRDDKTRQSELTRYGRVLSNINIRMDDDTTVSVKDWIDARISEGYNTVKKRGNIFVLAKSDGTAYPLSRFKGHTVEARKYAEAATFGSKPDQQSSALETNDKNAAAEPNPADNQELPQRRVFDLIPDGGDRTPEIQKLVNGRNELRKFANDLTDEQWNYMAATLNTEHGSNFPQDAATSNEPEKSLAIWKETLSQMPKTDNPVEKTQQEAAAETNQTGNKKPETPAPESIEYNGTKITKVLVKGAKEGDPPREMWSVQTIDNKRKSLEGGKVSVLGDTLHNTLDEAKDQADLELKQDQDRSKREELVEAEKRAEREKKDAIERDTYSGFLTGMSPNNKALARKALSKQYNFTDVNKVMTVRERIDGLHERGELEVSTSQEPKIKPMSRAQFNRADQRQQDAHEKRMREAGNKTVYLVGGSDVGKIGYDYASFLISQKSANSNQDAGGDLESDPLFPEFLRLAKATRAAEKDGKANPWTDAEKAAYESGDWRKFSRMRGYTEAEIAEFARYLEVADALIAKYGVDDVHGAEVNLNGGFDDDFSSWFDGSKIIDENGDPLIVYHGTSAVFEEFDISYLGKNTNNKGIFGGGFYFSDNKKFAEQFDRIDGKRSSRDNGRVVSAYLSIKRPFYWNESGSIPDAKAMGFPSSRIRDNKLLPLPQDVHNTKFTNALKESGYDGVIYDYKDGKNREIIAFSPDQIRIIKDVDDTNVADMPETPKGKIEDFGEKLEGAKKDVWQQYKEALKDKLPTDISQITLAKHFPEPNYDSLIAQGVGMREIAAVKAMRDEIPAKPRSEYKLRRWAQKVETMRDFTDQIINGGFYDIDSLLTMMRDRSNGLALFADRIEFYADLGYPAFTKAKDWNVGYGHYSVYDSIPYSPAKGLWTAAKGSRYGKAFETKAEAIDAARAAILAEMEAGPQAKTVELQLFMDRREKNYFIGKKIASSKIVRLKEGFASLKEARDYLRDNKDALTKDLEKRKEQPNERREFNEKRIGKDYRGDSNATPEKFAAEFGFRGVQFGNYVEQGRRVQDLNDAYDALMDMATIIGIPPRAISLNGSLGLAFGARGSGGKRPHKAHYEPGNIVINLTKNAGAGSLGHEWFHAMDHNFGKRDGNLYLSENYRYAPKVRKEISDAFKGLMEAIDATELEKRSKVLDETRSKDYWSTPREMGARTFEAYLVYKAGKKGEANDYLANIMGYDGWKEIYGDQNRSDYPYPTREELENHIAPAYDKLFAALQTRETDSGIDLYSLSGSTAGTQFYSDFGSAIITKKQAKEARDGIQADINRRMKELGFPQSNVVLFTDPNQTGLPYADSTVEGAYWRGLIYLSLNAADPVNVLDHEAIHALREAGAFTDNEWAILERNAEKWRKKYKIDERYGDLNLSEDRLNEEAIAHAFQDFTNSGIVRRIANRALLFIKTLGSILKGKPYSFKTVSDVFTAVDNGTIGRRGAQSHARGDGRVMFQFAWHGSPHTFESFSTKNIGSGEGAQAYGWGLYFSSKRDVAEWYHQKLSMNEYGVAYKGKTLVRPDGSIAGINEDWKDSLQMLVEWAVDEKKSITEAVAKARDEYSKMSVWQRMKFGNDEKLFQLIEDRGWQIADIPGQLYQVKIPEDNTMMLWDKEMSQQPAEVKKSAESIWLQIPSDLRDDYLDRMNADFDDLTGKEFYTILKRAHVDDAGPYHPDEMDRSIPNDEYASWFMSSNGINGIKYLDGSSRSRGSGTHNYVIFDDSNVEVTHAGSPADDFPMYKLGKAPGPALSTASQSLANIKGLDRSLMSDLKRMSAMVLHPHQIATLHKEFVGVYRAVIERHKTREVLVHQLSKRVALYNKLNAESKKKVNAVLELGRLDRKTYPVVKGVGVIVKNDSFDNTVHSKKGDTIRLTPAEGAAYKGVRETMDMALEKYAESILEDFGLLSPKVKTSQDVEKLRLEAVKAGNMDEVKRLKKVLERLNEVDDAKKKGYIPFKRWGEVGLSVKDADGNVVHFERIELPGGVFKKGRLGDNKTVAAALDRIKAQYNSAQYDINFFEMSKFDEVKAHLDLRNLDVLAATSEMSDADYQRLRQMLEEEMQKKGFRAHFIRSKDVPGYSEDFERAINDYIVSISSYISRRMHERKIEEEVASISSTGKTALYEYAREYQQYVNNPDEELATIRMMGFFWYLAGNISSGLVNLSQPLLVTAPWFKAQFSHAQIGKQMTKAYSDTAKMANVNMSGSEFFNFNKAPADVKDALIKAYEEGDFLAMATNDAMAISNSNTMALRGLDKKKRAVADAITLTFSIPERTNRIVTFISAYRLAMQPGARKKIEAFLKHDQLGRAMLKDKTSPEDFAFAYAEMAVVSTQYRVGKMNRPVMARGIGSLVFQFYSFVMQTLELMYKLGKVHGGQNKTALAVMILSIVAVAGLKGLPFEDDAQELIEKLFKFSTGKDLDIDTKVREAIVDVTGSPLLAEALIKGLPAALANVDLSGRLGFGNIAPDPENMTDIMGVWADMLYERPIRAAGYLAQGEELRAIAEVAPAFLRNPMQAYSWAEDGVRTQKGVKVIDADDVTSADVALKFFGFTSANITRERERIYATDRAGRAVDTLRSRYYSRMAKALAARKFALDEGDKASAADLEAQIKAINEERLRHNETAPLHERIFLHEPTVKQKFLEEISGAESRRIRKQARPRSEELKQIYGTD